MTDVEKAICESPIKPGEQVHILAVHLDGDGNRIGGANWPGYGLTNAQANDFLSGLIDVLNEYARKLNKEKNPEEMEMMEKRRDTLKR